MKNFHQVVKSAFSAFLLVSLFIFIQSANAGVLYFKMTAPKTTLEVGEEVTVSVFAWIDDSVASSDNGLDTWQLDLSVSGTGIVEITQTGGVADISLLAPSPLDTYWSGWNTSSVNSPATGEVREVVATQLVYGTPSLVGVGGYTEIFTFNIKALSAGTITYTICDDGGGLFYGELVDGTEYDNDVAAGSVVFDTENSDMTFTVQIPEPASMALFALAGLFSIIRKK